MKGIKIKQNSLFSRLDISCPFESLEKNAHYPIAIFVLNVL